MAQTAYRFGVFFFEAESGRLERDGRPVHLQPQPAQVLAALLSRAGEVVTRDELRRAVWPEDTWVDFDRGLNFCIAQVRGALGDTSTSPRFIRTVPKRGYEFIAPVQRTPPAPDEEQAATPGPAAAPAAPRPRPRWPIAAAVGIAAAGAAAAAYVAIRPAPRPPIVAIARFDNETGDPALSAFSDRLTDTLVEQLTLASGGRFAVIGNAAILRVPRERRDLSAIAGSLHAGYVVLGQLQGTGERLRVLSHLIRMPDQTHVGVNRTEGIASTALASSDEIAGRIARAFSSRLAGPSAGGASHAALTR